MQPHTINYFKHFNIDFSPDGWHDFIACEMCGSTSIDLHHIENRMKGVKHLDQVENIIALCRSCHEMAHANIPGYTKEELKTIHLTNI